VRLVALALLVAQASPASIYRDPQGRFAFSYPLAWGSPARGTNDGFQDRVAAVRFERFPSQLGGEAVLTRGRIVVDLQAIGGLYDPIALEVFPDALRARVIAATPPLTAASFCDALGRATHVDLASPGLAALPAAQRDAIGQVDRMRQVEPRVLRCDRRGDTIVFDKETALTPGAPRQRIYGAVRFLGTPYSTIQLIAGGTPPLAGLLDAMADVVRSFSAG
jgi:hypothetical protein